MTSFRLLVGLLSAALLALVWCFAGAAPDAALRETSRANTVTSATPANNSTNLLAGTATTYRAALSAFVSAEE